MVLVQAFLIQPGFSLGAWIDTHVLKYLAAKPTWSYKYLPVWVQCPNMQCILIDKLHPVLADQLLYNVECLTHPCMFECNYSHTTATLWVIKSENLPFSHMLFFQTIWHPTTMLTHISVCGTDSTCFSVMKCWAWASSRPWPGQGWSCSGQMAGWGLPHWAPRPFGASQHMLWPCAPLGTSCSPTHTCSIQLQPYG